MIEAMIAQETVDDDIVEPLRGPPRAYREVYLPAPRRPVWLGFYRIVRSLVRRRQETSAIRSARKDGEAAVMGVRMEASLADRKHNEQIQKLTRQNEDLRETVRTREDTIRVLRELDIPKLERQIGVLEAENEYLAACHERELNLKRAEIAVSNEIIAGGREAAYQTERGTR